LQSEERRKGKDGTMKGGWISTLQKAAATRREVYLVPKVGARKKADLPLCIQNSFLFIKVVVDSD
jgi:hypothetical protein